MVSRTTRPVTTKRRCLPTGRQRFVVSRACPGDAGVGRERKARALVLLVAWACRQPHVVLRAGRQLLDATSLHPGQRREPMDP